MTVTGRDPALHGENGSCLEGSHVTFTQMPHPSLFEDSPLPNRTELGGSAAAFHAGKSPRLMLPKPQAPSRRPREAESRDCLSAAPPNSVAMPGVGAAEAEEAARREKRAAASARKRGRGAILGGLFLFLFSALYFLFLNNVGVDGGAGESGCE